MREPKDKKFFKLAPFPYKRSKWNPLRYIFGEWTVTFSAQKWVNQQHIDTDDIEILQETKGE